MKIKYVLVLFYAFILNISIAEAQGTDQTLKPCPCCTEAHNEFDFWLGEWTVYNTQEQVVGTNKISKVKAY
ncbi:MAG: hypothetical protein HKN90_10245, partial [Flavobacteriaceae bacterium]|nr:hypothetical protein [Flavobacteriaceae bacterium]